MTYIKNHPLNPVTLLLTRITKMIESKYKVDIPYTDTVSFVFSAGTPSSQESPQYFDADVPSKCFTMAQAKVWVKQFAKGLESIGLEPMDKVLLFSENRLYFPVLLWGVLAARCVFTAASPSASVRGKMTFPNSKPSTSHCTH